MQNTKENRGLVKFNLTPSMSLELIKFNNLKKELNRLKEDYELDKNEKLLSKIYDVKEEMEACKSAFIREFRLNNQDEINEYLEKKDQF